ncbi:helix-turn-helix transcriptional regulator [Heyndrickxia sp. FSL W8-0496]|uniref:helix-turn-helix transcriptional regulator n=1 Tax=Heyndrickxia sp. FSL W8-0496 TaxID=2954702 RepID=UPI0030F73BAC
MWNSLLGDNMELKSLIGEYIEKSGLKKKFIADKIGVSVKQLRNYETGHSFIPMNKAFILADLLGKKVDDLYEWRKENEDQV